MELYDYSQTFGPQEITDYSKYFDKAQIKIPEIKKDFTIHFTSWGDYFTDIEVDGKTIWSGRLSRP